MPITVHEPIEKDELDKLDDDRAQARLQKFATPGVVKVTPVSYCGCGRTTHSGRCNFKREQKITEERERMIEEFAKSLPQNSSTVSVKPEVKSKIEVLTEEEYNIKYMPGRYASPEILEIAAVLEAAPFGSVVVIPASEGQEPGRRRDRFERHWKRWCKGLPYKLRFETITALNHFTIMKLAKEKENG